MSIKKINKGDLFSENNLWVKRPGTGPVFMKIFQNFWKKALNDIEKDEFIKLKDFK